MTIKSEDHSSDSSHNIGETPLEINEEDSSEKIKYTFKQYIGRVLMITETNRTHTSKEMIAELVRAKNEMYSAFCKEGVWKSEYIDRMFRLYADKNQDIKILKPQLKLFSKYFMRVPGIDSSEPIRITQYLKTLRFIRAWLDPLLQECKSFAKDAKNNATQDLKNTDEAFTVFENELDAEAKHVLAKQYLENIMSEYHYDQDRFASQANSISDCFDKHHYNDLMVFALLWFHYFEHKNHVYDAFTPEQLKNLQVAFTLPGFHPTALSLWAFLKIIEQLDFKKHIFSV